MRVMTLSEMRDLANARIAFCESEIRRLQKFIEEAEELVASDDQDRISRLPTASTAEILAASEDILARRGTPQSKGAIYDELVARGIRVPGRSPRGNLTAKFAIRKDIFRFDPATRLWWLARWSS